MSRNHPGDRTYRTPSTVCCLFAQDDDDGSIDTLQQQGEPTVLEGLLLLFARWNG